jgi:hypothetical protein
MTNRSSWNRKYWDLTEKFYWAPQYIGMKSISESAWQRDGGMISIPENMVMKGASIYTRRRNSSDHRIWMESQEEVLNQVFDITFAIAPDQLIELCFARPLGFTDTGPYISLGREIRQRYGWSSSENVAQQDGLFVSDLSVMGVELKLKAKSSPDQVIKYASLMAWEEIHSGPRAHLGLLYVLENVADTRHWRQCGLDGPEVDGSLLDRINTASLPKKIRELLSTKRDLVASILDRTSISAITWHELTGVCQEFCTTLDTSRAGDQTLMRLLEGLTAQIAEQVSQ